MGLKEFPLEKAFTFIEPGPVTMVTTSHGGRANIMTVSWHMVMDFTPRFALLTGPWNYSYNALTKTRVCVIAIPTVEMMREVIGVGNTTGSETDKFAEFGFTPVDASQVAAPLIGECYGNIECRVVEHIARHNIFVLEGLAAWINPAKKREKIFHYRGDGTFVADGRQYKHRALMRNKLAPGV